MWLFKKRLYQPEGKAGLSRENLSIRVGVLFRALSKEECLLSKRFNIPVWTVFLDVSKSAFT